MQAHYSQRGSPTLLELSRCGVAFFEAFVRSWTVTLIREVFKNGYPAGNPVADQCSHIPLPLPKYDMSSQIS